MKVCCTSVLSHSRTDLLRALVTCKLTTIYQLQKEIKLIANPCSPVKSPIIWWAIEIYSLFSSSPPYPNWHWVVRGFQVSLHRRLFTQIKLPERDAYNIPPSSTEVTNLNLDFCGSVLLHDVMIRHTLNFVFSFAS